MGTGTLLSELIKHQINRQDFAQSFIGQWWKEFSDLNKWSQEGIPSAWIYKILQNFSRDEAQVMIKFFPLLYFPVTPAAWILVYHPVQGAVGKVWNDGGQKVNAVRHMTWMCQASRFLNMGDEFAIALGEAHEKGRKGTPADQVADRINNAISLYLTANASAAESCFDIAQKAWNLGILARNDEFKRTGIASIDESELPNEMVKSWVAGLVFLGDVGGRPMFEVEDFNYLEKMRVNKTLYEKFVPSAKTLSPSKFNGEL